MTSTPQDAGEIARQAAFHLVEKWRESTYPWTRIGERDIARLRDAVCEAIEADRQAERDRHAAGVARVQEQTNASARIIAFNQAAAALCYRCESGKPVTCTPKRGYIHTYGNSRYSCPAHEIHRLIAQEEARRVND